MKKKSVFIQLLLLVSLVFVTAFATKQTAADQNDGTVTFTLHKKSWDKAPNDVQNTGEEMDFQGDPIAGAGFTVYDVTTSYYNLRETKTQVKAIETIQADLANYATSTNKVTDRDGVSEIFTDADGLATFENLASKNIEKDAVYLIVETTLPDKVTLQSAPLVITLPVLKLDSKGNQTDEIITDIHLYPKNLVEEPAKPVNPGQPAEPDKPGKPIPSKPRLPQTGEAKSMLSLLGILLVGIAVALWKKRSTQTN